MSRLIRAGCALVIVAAIWGAGVAQEGAISLSKPLAAYTIGDLIPRIAQAAMDDVGRNWQRSGQELRALSEGRQRQVREAIPVVKDEIQALKARLKVARAQKKTVESGTLGGELASAEAVLDVLDSLQDHSAEQMKLAEAWVAAGVALRDFDQADRAFDAHRQRRIIQSESVGRGADERLDAAGYEVFRQRARALETLGKRLSDLGSEAKSVGKSDMKFMDELERHGRIQPRR